MAYDAKRVLKAAIEAAESDSGTCPSFCRMCGKRGEDAEPDAQDMVCEYCGCTYVDSALILAGMI